MINKIIAPIASQWAVVRIPQGSMLYEAKYGGQLSSEDAYYSFTTNGKQTSKDYTVLVSDLLMHDILFNKYTLIDGEGYVMIPTEGIVWYNSQEEAEKVMYPTTKKDSLIDWLKKPLISEPKRDPDMISGYVSRTISANLFYITQEGGATPTLMKRSYIPTRFTSILVLVLCVVGGVLYHLKKK